MKGKFIIFSIIPTTFSFCAKPKGEVAESNIIENSPLRLGEGGPSQTVGEGRERALFLHPSSALTGTFSPVRRFSFAF